MWYYECVCVIMELIDVYDVCCATDVVCLGYDAVLITIEFIDYKQCLQNWRHEQSSSMMKMLDLPLPYKHSMV